MNISKLSIKNYRSCTSIEFSPNQGLSALIGPNGSGKTNILSAIKLLSNLTDTRSRHLIRDDIQTSISEIKVWFNWNGKSIIYTAKLNLVTNEKNQDEVLANSQSWYMYQVTGSKRNISIPIEIISDLFMERQFISSQRGIRNIQFSRFIRHFGLRSEELPAIEAVGKFLSDIRYYSASQFTNPTNCPISFEVEEASDSRRGISITGHKRLLYDMYEEFKSNSDSYNEFLSLIGKDGIGLVEEIDFKEIKTSSSKYTVMTGGKVKIKEKINLLVVPSFRIANSSLSPSQLSEGTFKTIALIFYLVTDKSSLLMIEEPEVCVHYGLLSSIVELIKTYSQEKQILISTHSDAVLDALSIDNVFKVKRDKEKGTIVSSIVKKMGSKDLAALKDYLHNEGSLGEFWKHGDLEHV